MNTNCEKVKKIMWRVIDCSPTQEMAMEILKIKFSWLYPYITPEVYREHHKYYLETKAKGYDLEWTMT